ncbi:MAG: bifunctional phosphopantothenoylcysteine decarboxylase/phosphopantothenate--cysteine ligase CoaBC [Ignavibacteria bacterium]|nr:bifunctional phosphopantothenoylcysteine decarboxylase/phosphopantothenate--cysteine ligase CoaBC [Ignavibacteria bacterium]
MNIILGITGSVSAYKTPWLVRDLQRAGHSVRVVMSESATNFVTPLALQTVSKHIVVTNPFSAEVQEGGSWHVHWAEWADALLVVPCSAASLGRICHGIPDNAVLLVAASMPPEKIVISPAMDSDMWQQASTQRNVEQLKTDGYTVIDPESGNLASGLEGTGRLPELNVIVQIVHDHFNNDSHGNQTELADVTGGQLAGKHCVVTAGPTVEPIDAVRSIINHSTGKMGYAIAEALREAGALVTLISGPVSIPAPVGVTVVHVQTAHEMLIQVMQYSYASVIIMAAAVADFTPVSPVINKIKKDQLQDGKMTLGLKPTIDILQTLGEQKQPHQVIVGFALETENVVSNGIAKLNKKNVDMIVANEQGENTGLGSTTNQITILTKGKAPVSVPLMEKRACAAVLVQHIQRLLEMKAEDTK